MLLFMNKQESSGVLTAWRYYGHKTLPCSTTLIFSLKDGICLPIFMTNLVCHSCTGVRLNCLKKGNSMNSRMDEIIFCD